MVESDQLKACESAKAAGNSAVLVDDFKGAEQHYTQALNTLMLAVHSRDNHSTLRLTLLCNRAYVRQKHGLWQAAVEDATAVLNKSTEDACTPSLRKLRVKALFRRALANEALGKLQEAFCDLNLALKLAPGNKGIIAAAQRLKELQRPGVTLGEGMTRIWQPEYPFCTKLVLKLADSDAFPERIRGYTCADSNTVVKFPNGIGVAVHHADGGLSAIWPLGPAGMLPMYRERAEIGSRLEAMIGPPELGDDLFSEAKHAPS